MTFSEFASHYIGVHEGTKTHHKIIDDYNKIRPLPRNYKVTYNDAWCATFASFVMKHCNAINPPYECGVQDMYKKALKNGQIVSTPKVNDFVLYDWGNDGSLNHIGVISAINYDILTVIEGNKNDEVGVRHISKHSPYVAYYIRVRQKTNKSAIDYEQVATDIIKGKYGNGDARKKKLASLGIDYNKAQAIVNKRLKK